MNGRSKNIKILMLLIIILALTFSTAFIMIIKATEDSESAKFKGSYTIEYLIKNYNLVTLDDVSGTEHVVGPILVGGNINSALFHSQTTRNISSYIKGKILSGGNVSSNDGNPTLYLGTGNKVETSEHDGTTVNGKWYTNNPVVVTDSYLDFEKLFGNIRSQSRSLIAGKTVKPDEEGTLTIKIGEEVTIEKLADVKQINITGSASSTDLTLINIKESGSIKIPDLTVNGTQINTDSSDVKGTAIVWNFPNATNITMSDHATIGHIVAPNADITASDTNYAGCMIAKSLSGHIEGHYYIYNDGTIPKKDKPKEPEGNNTVGNNTVGNNTVRNNTVRNNTVGNNTVGNNTVGNNTVENKTEKAKNNTTKPKNNTTKPKNNTTGNNTEDGDVLGASRDKNKIKKNNTTTSTTIKSKDNTTSNSKLPQTGKEISKEAVLGCVMVVLAILFGIKYIRNKNKLDANK